MGGTRNSLELAMEKITWYPLFMASAYKVDLTI